MKKKANNISKEQALEIQNKILKETIKQLKIDKSNLEISNLKHGWEKKTPNCPNCSKVIKEIEQGLKEYNAEKV